MNVALVKTVPVASLLWRLHIRHCKFPLDSFVENAGRAGSGGYAAQQEQCHEIANGSVLLTGLSLAAVALAVPLGSNSIKTITLMHLINARAIKAHGSSVMTGSPSSTASKSAKYPFEEPPNQRQLLERLPRTACPRRKPDLSEWV
jgi:hypothetical protein